MKSHDIAIALFTLMILPNFAASARAADSCQPVFDALRKVATTPSHSYTTNTSVNGGNPAEGETIFANGQKYIRARGKWMRIPVTSQDVLEQEKEKEEKGKSTCQFLRNESVNGEAAKLYSVHREYDEVKEDGRCGYPQAPDCFCASKRTWITEATKRTGINQRASSTAMFSRRCEAVTASEKQ
jgi:hypothetical protein